MKKAKLILKRVIVTVIKKTPLVNTLAKKTKLELIRKVDSLKQGREIYDKDLFYPTISEYFAQTQSSLSKGGPLISILLPTYNTPIEYLRECIDSIIMQSYPNWELCIADDASPDTAVVECIKGYQSKDKRIKLVERKKNGHISLASNSALELATGKYTTLMDHDDVLWPNALYEFVKVINENSDIDFIYSDEDKIDGTGKLHSYPFLKPDYSPEFLESCNYITHFSCIRTSLLKEVGGFRKGYEGAQDWDLFIRLSEVTNKIHHISKILYSWRIHEASTASNTDAKPYVYEAQLALLNDHVKRIGKKGEVEKGIITQHRTIKYQPEVGSKLCVLIDGRGVNSHAIEATMSTLQPLIKTENTYIVGLKKSNNSATYNQPVDILEKLKPKSTVLYIKAGIELVGTDWSQIGVADTQIDGVGCVFPVLLSGEKMILSAGVGVGYGNGLLDMLNGNDLDDQHYTRGLYAKSRRNVTCGNNAIFFCSLEIAKKILSKDNNVYKNMVELVDSGYRHIYTPFIKAKADSLPVLIPHPEYKNYRDKYLNKSFNHENQNMEVIGEPHI